MRRIATIAGIVMMLCAALGVGVASPAQAVSQHGGGGCHAVQRLGFRGSVCLRAGGNSVIARASFTSDGIMFPVPIRVCVVIYNADIGPVAGTCKHVGPGVTVTATAPRQEGIYVAQAFILKPFWLDFGVTPDLTVCGNSCPE